MLDLCTGMIVLMLLGQSLLNLVRERLVALHIFVDKLFCVGETADTLNALRYCKERGALIVGITNTGIKNQQCVQH